MNGFPTPVPPSPAPYYALAGPWATQCVIWDQLDVDDPTLAYVTMGAWHDSDEDPFALVTTILGPRFVTPTGHFTTRHLVEWACTGLLPSEIRDYDTLVARGSALESPWEPVDVYCAGQPHRFVRLEGSSQVVLASADLSLPVVIIYRGEIPLPLGLVDCRDANVVPG